MYRRGNKLYVAISDPTNTRALDDIKFATNLTVEPILVDEDRLRKTIDQALLASDNLGQAEEGDEGLENLEATGGDDDNPNEAGVDSKGDDTPVVKFINKVLLDAIKRGASDIHFEPYENEFRVRMRMDGMLRAMAKAPGQAAPAHLRPPEGHGAVGHRRTPGAAGRPHQAERVQDPADGLPRQLLPDPVRREDRAAPARRLGRQGWASTSWATRTTRRSCTWTRCRSPTA